MLHFTANTDTITVKFNLWRKKKGQRKYKSTEIHFPKIIFTLIVTVMTTKCKMKISVQNPLKQNIFHWLVQPINPAKIQKEDIIPKKSVTFYASS